MIWTPVLDNWIPPPPHPQRAIGFRYSCQNCGRFVRDQDAHLGWDGYMGGWEADPHCAANRGCQKGESTP